MSRKIIYQTLKDFGNGNDEQVRNEGPFMCTTDEAWLGHGYYFWDTFLHLAHWWGESMVKKPYMICKAECDFSSKVCFDLQGDTEHMALFDAIVDVMEKEGLIDEETTVSDVIYHLKDRLGIFHWKALRVSGVHSISPNSYPHYTFRMQFVVGQKHFVDYKPAIQICIYDLEALDFKNYEIIYPEKYQQAI